MLICKIYGILYKCVYCSHTNSFDWGKFKLADEFEKHTNKIDIITGKRENDVPEDVRKKKEDRLRKQKITAWLRRNAIIYTCVLALVLVAVVAVAVIIKNAVKKSVLENPEKSAVLTIDGEHISCEEFSFFCSMVIESDDFKELALSDDGVAALSAKVKAVAAENAEEFICKVHEEHNAVIVVSEKEISDIASSIELATKSYKNKDEYCTKFYGLSYEEYINFRKQVILVSKYITDVSSRADTSSENQKKVYGENEKELVSLDVKLIYMDKQGLSEQEIATKRTNAGTLLNYVKEGLDIGQLSEVHSDENSLFNVSEHEGNNFVRLSRSVNPEFLPVFESVADISAGETRLVETENEICVIYCADRSDFEDSLDSKELISYVKQTYASEYFENVMSGGKYSAAVNSDLYNSVDISSYVETMRKAYSQGG